jgi:hypothetical protein
LLADQRIQSVDTIEIEPVMVQGAKAYGPRVERAYNDPRSNIVIDDAKSYFAGQRDKYDVIISEPSNPWISGVGALFSKEFYDFVPRHLNKNGLFVQWIQLYEIDDALLGSILGALTPAFADYGAWLSNKSDLIIVASSDGILPNLDMDRLLVREASRNDLNRLGINHQSQLEFRKVADSRLLRALSKLYPEQRTNSDYWPVLGLEAPKARFKGVSSDTSLTLPIINRPLLEALGVGDVLPENVEIPKHRHFTADDLTARARSLVQEILGEQSPHSPNVVFLHAAMRNCGRQWSPDQRAQFISSISDLADRTIKYLPATMLEGVWIHPKWLTCPNLPTDMGRVTALLEAHALRDYAQMAVLGEEWIRNRPTDATASRYFDGYAWSGIVLNTVKQKRWADLNAVLDRMEKSSTVNPEFSFLQKIARGLAQEVSHSNN